MLKAIYLEIAFWFGLIAAAIAAAQQYLLSAPGAALPLGVTQDTMVLVGVAGVVLNLLATLLNARYRSNNP